MRIGVIGIGAIGGATAARLLRAKGADETIALAAGSERHAEALRASGLTVEDEGGRWQVPVPAQVGAALPDLGAPYDLMLLCTRTDVLETALGAAAPLLSPEGAVVCIQNGLPEERASRVVGAERTLGAVVGWSGQSDGPGRFRVTSKGPLTLGAFSAAARPRLAAARALLARTAPVRLTDNLDGARWTKLALNCALSSLGAATGLSLGELASRRAVRRLAMRIVGEVLAVAEARGVRLEKVSGLRPSWVARGPALIRHLLIWAACQPHRRQRSGMLARLEAGRPAGQVDDLNGAVAAAARERGLEAPLNARLCALVHAIERGEERIGLHQIARLGAPLR